MNHNRLTEEHLPRLISHAYCLGLTSLQNSRKRDIKKKTLRFATKFWLTLHCPLRQTPLLGVSEHGVPSLTLPNDVVSPSVVAQLKTHLGEPKNNQMEIILVNDYDSGRDIISFRSKPIHTVQNYKFVDSVWKWVDISKTQTELTAYSARLLSESLQFSLWIVTRMKQPSIADLDVHVRQNVPPVCSIGRI